MATKSPEAFRTISEVAEWLDVPAHVLRFWESRFTQVKPVKRAGGRRYYRPADMELLGGIKRLLHDDGMTIRGVQKMLREDGVRRVASLSPPLHGGPDPAADNVVSLTATGTPPTIDTPPDRWPFSEDPEAAVDTLNEQLEAGRSPDDTPAPAPVDDHDQAAPDADREPALQDRSTPDLAPDAAVPAHTPPATDIERSSSSNDDVQGADFAGKSAQPPTPEDTSPTDPQTDADIPDRKIANAGLDPAPTDRPGQAAPADGHADTEKLDSALPDDPSADTGARSDDTPAGSTDVSHPPDAGPGPHDPTDAAPGDAPRPFAHVPEPDLSDLPVAGRPLTVLARLRPQGRRARREALDIVLDRARSLCRDMDAR